MIEIDATFDEGGGQILAQRTGLAGDYRQPHEAPQCNHLLTISRCGLFFLKIFKLLTQAKWRNSFLAMRLQLKSTEL